MTDKVVITAHGDEENFFITDEYGWKHRLNRKDCTTNKVLMMLLPALRLIDLNYKHSTPLFECDLYDLHSIIGLTYIDGNMLKELIKNANDLDSIKVTLLAAYMTHAMEDKD